jgi:hypothetical protein
MSKRRAEIEQDDDEPTLEFIAVARNPRDTAVVAEDIQTAGHRVMWLQPFSRVVCFEATDDQALNICSGVNNVVCVREKTDADDCDAIYVE